MVEQIGEFHRYLLECLTTPTARPAHAVDKRLLSLLLHLQERIGTWHLLDYGCGNGVLLQALATLPQAVISHMQYVGLDPDSDRLATASILAESLGLSSRVTLAKPVDYFSRLDEPRFDLVFLVNVLHELPIKQAPWILSGLLCRLRERGLLVVSDMSKLPEGENNYVCWDESNFLGFRTEGVNISFQHSVTQRTLTSVFETAIALKQPRSSDFTADSDFTPDSFDPSRIALVTFDSFKQKRERIEEKMKELVGRGEERTRDFAVYLTEFRNLTVQLEPSFGYMGDSVEWAYDAVCPVCQCWLIEGGGVDIDWESAYSYKWCPLCAYEEGSHHNVGYDYINGCGKPQEMNSQTPGGRRSILLARREEAIKHYGIKYILALKGKIWNTSG